VSWIDALNASVGVLPFGGGRLEVLYWAHDPRLPDNSAHRHTYFEACLVGEYGAGIFDNLGEAHALEPATLFLARPGATHFIRNDSEALMELYWVSFAWTPGDAAPRSDAERLMRRFAESRAVCADGQALLRLWQGMRAIAETPSVQATREQLRHLAQALVIGIAQALTDAPEWEELAPDRHSAAKLAVRYIEDNLNRPLAVAEIAAHVGLSERHLHRVFLDFAGTSPAQYVLTARLDRARGLVHRTALPMKEIARQTGFADVPYFTRAYVRRFGAPPARDRDQKRFGGIVQTQGELV